jgi:23S rRNA (adenine2503-C2)-methyltransferase
MPSEKSNIRNLSLSELIHAITQGGFPKFRASQVYDWLWKRNARAFDDMRNVSLPLIEFLNEHFLIDHLTVDSVQKSSDKTIKCGFKTIDGQIIEGVLIPTSKRMTACISSQAGCSLSCAFCATGKLKLMKNLSAGEIVDQVVELNELATSNYSIPLSNIVLMGMGEPLLNYKQVISALEILTDPNRFNISPRRITLSTAGIAKMIMKLGDEQVRFNLALSLHAADDIKRSEVMEINDSNNLATLSEALIYFHERTGSRITFEYILFKDFNDSLEDASNLANFARCVPCKINIIEYNSIGDSKFTKASAERTEAFTEFLERRNLIVNVRRSRGKDIDAACGQLANKVNQARKLI